MVILGIDPGLRTTGWGVVEHIAGSPKYVECGVICTNTKDNIEKRLLVLHVQLLEILNLYNPKAVALEKIYVNQNGNTTLKLGEARGVVLMTPALKGLEVYEYSPNTVKQNITGRGHASKDEVNKMVHLILALHNKLHNKHDAIDALAIALCHYFFLKL